VLFVAEKEPDMMTFWRDIVRYSLVEANEIYNRLGVSLRSENVCGESFYNDRLPSVVEDLKKLGLPKSLMVRFVFFRLD